MHFTYCPRCGNRLVEKEIGDEGLLPYCETCSIPYWDSFSTCVICAVVNEYQEIALIRQSYVSTANYVCVAGYMKLGESAEDCARREISEELGLAVTNLQFVQSYPYPGKELLMLGFLARVQKDRFRLSGEVDCAEWFPIRKAADHIKNGSIAWNLVSTVKELL